MDKKLIKKHDELSKKFLTDLNSAKLFLELHLDSSIVAKCDLDTLSIETGSYVDGELRTRFSDIVYKVNLRQSIKQDSIYTHSI